QPLHLRGAGRHIELAVERDDVPISEVIAVVAFGRVPRRGADVAEVPGRARGVVVVVAGDGTGTGQVSAPRRGVPLGVVGGGTHGVGVVAEPDHGPRDTGGQVQGGRSRVLG